jgi:hypothetical protein
MNQRDSPACEDLVDAVPGDGVNQRTVATRASAVAVR